MVVTYIYYDGAGESYEGTLECASIKQTGAGITCTKADGEDVWVSIEDLVSVEE